MVQVRFFLVFHVLLRVGTQCKWQSTRLLNSRTRVLISANPCVIFFFFFTNQVYLILKSHDNISFNDECGRELACGNRSEVKSIIFSIIIKYNYHYYQIVNVSLMYYKGTYLPNAPIFNFYINKINVQFTILNIYLL